MDSLKNQLRKRLAEKFLGKQAIGVLVEREIKRHYPDYDFQAYVKFDKIFVQSSDKSLQISLFKDKKNILEQVNLKLEKFGYSQKMREIICKVGLKGEEEMVTVFDRK
jgi:hypothetical protein